MKLRSGKVTPRENAADIGDGIRMLPSRWTFGGDTPGHFDSHIARSVPNYREGHRLIEQISDFFIKRNSLAYDIGTSTGTLVKRLAARHPAGTRWVGIDLEESMIKFAQTGQDAGGGNVSFFAGDACDFDYQPCDLVVAYYTVQFVHPRRRQQLVDAIYRSLNWGGAFLLFEKVRAPDARFQDIATALYTDYKLENGYAPGEILGKARSLKGVLEPFSTQGNLDLLKRAGFVDVMSVYKHICFEGFLSIK